MYAEVSHTVERDLLRAEMIAVPITLVLLLFIFRGVVAAALPLAIGALSVVGGLLVLLVVNSFTQVSVFALNLTTAMGLGLAIDYSLFMVSRFREELRDHAPDEAVRRTVATAGRTVLFSALTVAIALSALLLFNISFLRSFAYAGLAVATLSGIYAIVVLPAILGGLGHRVDALPVGRRRGVEAVDVGRFLKRAGAARSFDLVFADPPYAEAAGWFRIILSAVAGRSILAPGAWLILEHAAREPLAPAAGWSCLKRRVYGETQIDYLAPAGAG